MSSPLLHYRAGPGALRLLRERGLTAGTLRTIVGPATGPRWLALVGLDRALVDSGLLDGGPPKLHVGGSAGAWRSLALASPDPGPAHRELVEGYIGQSFPRRVASSRVSAAYREMLRRLLAPERVGHLLGPTGSEVALHAVRTRWPLGSRRRLVQLTALACVGAATALSRHALAVGTERVLFHSRPDGLGAPFAPGRIARLTEENLLDAALASGTVPLYMLPVRDPAGAPAGRYIDGGVTDYHLRQLYHPIRDGITLLFHHEPRLVPTWFDKRRSRRRPSPVAVDPLLLVHPSPEFVAGLPAGKLPDRQDFLELADRPAARQGRWREAVKRSESLGRCLLDDLASGRLVDRLEPLETRPGGPRS